MKIVISFIVALLTLPQAEARSYAVLDLTKYEFAVSSEKGYEEVTATFSSDGFLTVQAQVLGQSHTLHQSMKDQTAGVSAEKRLDSRNSQIIKGMVLRLANAKIVESFSEIVCKIAITPETSVDHLHVLRDFNYETQNFEGSMKLIKGPTSCAIAHHVSLEHDFQNDWANQLKTTLKVLALETVGDQLGKR